MPLRDVQYQYEDSIAQNNSMKTTLLKAKRTIIRFTPEPIVLLYHLSWAIFGVVLYRHPSRNLIVIGVTGTKGKTTTTALIHSVISATGAKAGLFSTIETRIGDAVYKNRTHMSMAGRGRVQRILRKMVNAGCQYAVLEVPSEGIRHFRDFGVMYDSVVFTNLSPEHLVTHKTFENYKKTKGRLFRRFARTRKNKIIGGTQVPRFALINADDQHADYFYSMSESPIAERILFGFGNEATTRIQAGDDAADETMNQKNTDNRTDTANTFSFDGDSYTIPFPGRISVYNAVPAVFFAKRYGNAAPEKIRTTLSSIKVLPGRMERIDVGQPFTVFCDYAHEPLSIAGVYDALKGYAASNSRIIMLVGAIGGSRWRYNAKEIAETATKLADITVLTIVDAYNDNPQDMLRELIKGAKRNSEAEWHAEADRRKAIQKTLALARAGDVVIITGKGNEITFETSDGSVPWDERAIVREETAKIARK